MFQCTIRLFAAFLYLFVMELECLFSPKEETWGKPVFAFCVRERAHIRKTVFLHKFCISSFYSFKRLNSITVLSLKLFIASPDQSQTLLAILLAAFCFRLREWGQEGDILLGFHKSIFLSEVHIISNPVMPMQIL